MKDILKYNEIVEREGFNVQRGMNFRPQNNNYSILLMSVRENSPYNDGFDKKGEKLIYEGEDISKRESHHPKEIDQPLFTKNGKPTNNNLFFKAAEDYKSKRREKPETIKVYEKINPNVWSDKGWFNLVDVKFEYSKLEKRKVFKFILLPDGSKEDMTKEEIEEFEFSRRIPTSIKRKVWERDGGKCSHPDCESNKDLHFDHIIPYSKGGSSTDDKNIQILCSKHNLKKSDKII
ncbi:MAG: HNH endonuclease [bacterium]